MLNDRLTMALIYSNNKLIRFFVLLLCLVASGCQAVVYSNLDEKEANEMVSVLFSNGIMAERQQVDDLYSIAVDKSNLPIAISTLKANGLPKAKFASLGEIFGGDELVRTPFHEHARFIHATSQELAQSISEIEGVLTARVHVMLPEKSAISKKRVEKSSAAVFVYTDKASLKSTLPPIIKTLIAHSIDGLDYDGVAVAMFDSQKVASNTTENIKNPKLLTIDRANAGTLVSSSHNANTRRATMWLSSSERIGLLFLVFIFVTFLVFSFKRKTNKMASR